MDDVDAVQAQIARNMLDSGDWTIARLDGVAYLEKSPLIYWLIALTYRMFGVHDWAARLPVALSAVFLCWLTARYARWAFGEPAGLCAGLVLPTCVGLFLFTRIQIPDVMLTATVCGAFWSFERALDENETHPRMWAALLAASLGLGLLLKGLIALVAPVGGALLYLAVTGRLFSKEVWQRLHVPSGALIALAIAAPWHALATLRMPPYFDLTLHSGPGQYHGFFWFYFINEHLLRFLNLRYPRDYNTVPRPAFWLLHFLWLFPWSAYLGAAAKMRFRPVDRFAVTQTVDRAGRTRLLALCWTGFLLVFFTLSTTQEYYSMPVYPALALLLGSAMASETWWVRTGTKALGVICSAAFLASLAILWQVRAMPAPGDISAALRQHPEAYTLSLGHMGDLTLASFAYLRRPLALAALAFLIGAAGASTALRSPRKLTALRSRITWTVKGSPVFFAFAAMMVLFAHAARLALVAFDPYLSSKPIAEALNRAPAGQLIMDGAYYDYSSVFFYTNRTALLWNGRVNNLEYGSYAPGAPAVFIDDAEFVRLWSGASRCYVVTDDTKLPRLERLVGRNRLRKLEESGGKFLFTNEGTDIAKHQ